MVLTKDMESHLRLSVDKIANNKSKQVGGHRKGFLVLVPHISGGVTFKDVSHISGLEG